MTDETLEVATKIIETATDCICTKEEFRPCRCRDAARQIIDLAQRQEREACAKVAETYLLPDRRPEDERASYRASCIAESIRARSLPSPDEEPK